MSEETKTDICSTDHKGQVPINTMEKPLTRVRQEEHDILDQTAESKIIEQDKIIGQEESTLTIAREETWGESMAHMNLCGNLNAGEVTKKNQDDRDETERARVSKEKGDEMKQRTQEKENKTEHREETERMRKHTKSERARKAKRMRL